MAYKKTLVNMVGSQEAETYTISGLMTHKKKQS